MVAIGGRVHAVRIIQSISPGKAFVELGFSDAVNILSDPTSRWKKSAVTRIAGLSRHLLPQIWRQSAPCSGETERSNGTVAVLFDCMLPVSTCRIHASCVYSFQLII